LTVGRLKREEKIDPKALPWEGHPRGRELNDRGSKVKSRAVVQTNQGETTREATRGKLKRERVGSIKSKSAANSNQWGGEIRKGSEWHSQRKEKARSNTANRG